MRHIAATLYIINAVHVVVGKQWSLPNPRARVIQCRSGASKTKGRLLQTSSNSACEPQTYRIRVHASGPVMGAAAAASYSCPKGFVSAAACAALPDGACCGTGAVAAVMDRACGWGCTTVGTRGSGAGTVGQWLQSHNNGVLAPLAVDAACVAGATAPGPPACTCTPPLVDTVRVMAACSNDDNTMPSTVPAAKATADLWTAMTTLNGLNLLCFVHF